jgi:hypothetical protein
MFKIMSSLGARGHVALTLFIILSYAALTTASILRHSERSHCRHLSLRATRLLREAAKSSLKADKKGLDVTERYAEALKGAVYIEAVDHILSAQEVARFTGVSIDEMRGYVEQQAKDALVDLNDACSSTPLGSTASKPKTGSAPPASSINVPAVSNHFVW